MSQPTVTPSAAPAVYSYGLFPSSGGGIPAGIFRESDRQPSGVVRVEDVLEWTSSEFAQARVDELNAAAGGGK